MKMKALILICASFLFFGFAGKVSAATLYWYGGTGNWSSATGHWSTNSGNSPSADHIAPISTDTAVFDSNSGSGTVTIDASGVSVTTLTESSANITISTASNGITVAGDLTVNKILSGANAVTLSGASNTIYGTGTISAPITLGANYTINTSGTTLLLSGNIGGGAHSLTVTGAGTTTFSGANTFSSGLDITSGTVIGITATAFGAGSVTLGDNGVTGSYSASMFANVGATIANPIVLGANPTDILTIGNYNDTYTTFSGGVTGNNNFILVNNNGNGYQPNFATGSINNTGNITNSGRGAGGYKINSVIGSNVTGVIQNSATSPLTLSGANTFPGGLTILSGTVIGTVANAFGGSGTGAITLGNTSGSASATLQGNASVTFNNPISLATNSNHPTLTIGSSDGFAPNFGGSITGTNNLVINSLNSPAYGYTVTISGSVNNTGTVTNTGVGGQAPVTISGIIGNNVTGVIQNSATSPLTLSGNNSSVGGNITITTGTLAISGTTGISLTGNFSNSGTFTANSSTVTFASGTHTITGANTFYNLTLAANNTITFPANTTQTISNGISCAGSSGNLININSSVPSSQATLSMGAGKTATCDYLSLTDSAVTGGATWNAGSNSTFVSNDSGWVITIFPGTLSEISHTNTGATLSWTSGTGGRAPVTAQLQRSPSGAGTWSNVSGATASPSTDTGLSASTAYDYRVAFTDALSTVAYSNTFTITTNATAVTTYIVKLADLWDNGYDNVNNPRQSTFSRFVFNTDASSIAITGDTNVAGGGGNAHLGVRVDGVEQSPLIFSASDVPQTFTVNLGSSGTMRTVEVVAGLQSLPGGTTIFGSFIDSVTYSNSFTFAVSSPVVSNRVVVYGDSIAAGGNATNPESQAYIPLLRNLYGQSVMAEAWGFRTLAEDIRISGGEGYVTSKLNTFVSRLASYTPSTMWVAIGSNDYGFGGWRASNFGLAYAALLDSLHTALPSTRIVCQTPLLRTDEGANSFGNTLGDYRAEIATVCNARSWTTLVDGTSLLTLVETGGLHPDTAGHAKYAKRIAPILAQPSYTSLGPSSGVVSQASTVFTVTLGNSAPFLGDQTITISDGGNGGTFTPSVGSPGSSSVIVTPAAAATSFTFTYTPASMGTKTLTFTNGQSGWSNPNNVSYSVSLPTYTIGGTISGLSGTVVLQNNGGDNYSTSTNGTFVFATGLNNSASYAVTVSTQPTGQNCTVGNGSGTVSSANITSVTVSCITKTTPTLSVTNSPITYNISPQTATVSGSVAGTVSGIKYNGSGTAPTTAGTYAITADFAPTDSADYNALSGASAGNFIISTANQGTLTFTGQTVTSPTTFSALSTTGGSGTGSVTYAVTTVGTAGCSIVGTTLSYTTAGTCGVTATKAADSNYNSVSSSEATFTINAIATPTVTTHSSSGGNASSQVSNLLSMGNYTLAEQIAKQYGIAIPNTPANNNTPLQPIPPSIVSQSFTRTLRQGMTNSDVKRLQIFLNTQGFLVAQKGAGSPGHETTYFGPATKSALMKFQSAYKSQTLDPQGLKAPTGFFGMDTMKTVNGMVK